MSHFSNAARHPRFAALTATACLLGSLLGPVFSPSFGLGGSALAAGELRIGNVGEPETLDPHHVAGVWENRILGDLFLGLTTEAADGSTIPGAAESWEIDASGTVYTFKLRDHTWSDGTPVSADDVVFATRRVLSPETAAKYASIMYPVKNAEAYNTGKITDPAQVGVRAIDAKTVEYTLKSPTPYFVDLLSHYTSWPVPKHVVEEHGDDWVKKANIVTNGAFLLDEWVPNSHVKLVKSPTFYDADNVSLDRVTFYPTEDRNTVQRRFRAGEIDFATDFASEQIDWLRENLAEETRIAPYLGIYFYTFNVTRPPFDDKRVRKALAMGIDTNIITEKVLKTGEVGAYSMVPPGMGNYGEPSYVAWKDTPYKERIASAKALLAEAGYGKDNPLKFTLSYNTSENHKRIAVAVSSMWKQLGVTAELFNSEVKVHYNRVEENDYEVARVGWIADYNDPQNILFLLQTSSGKLNYGRYSNPAFDSLMDKANATVDLDERAKVLAEAEAILMDDMPIIPIYYYVSKNLVSTKLDGWMENASDWHRSRWISIN